MYKQILFWKKQISYTATIGLCSVNTAIYSFTVADDAGRAAKYFMTKKNLYADPYPTARPCCAYGGSPIFRSTPAFIYPARHYCLLNSSLRSLAF